ncbi:MAG: Hsp33 family molecular chaperone HslO [Burkholderiaceae bacterium]
MSELHKFLFDGMPVRGIIVRLTDAWTEILRRRASNNQTGAYAAPVAELVGEMVAASALMQSNIKFDGALVMQIMGDGPVKLAVAEVQPDLALRATATVVGTIAPDMRLSDMVNVNNAGRCAITLDPKSRLPGQLPYQGVVPLYGDQGEKLQKLSDVVQHYMLQSEQLDTTLVLAANDTVAAGLLVQRLPMQGTGNLAGGARQADEDEIGRNEDYNRIALLASSLKRDELLTLGVDAILHRLFWQEPMLRFAPQPDDPQPHFVCSCSREKVGAMIVSLGEQEAAGILAERADIEVGCEFCGVQYRFDAIDAAQLFRPQSQLPPTPGSGTH